MKTFSRIIALVALVTLITVSSAEAALNAYLQLKPVKAGGKTYKAFPDASGKFSFANVEPGSYELAIAGDEDYFKGRAADAQDIEIMSFSWGATTAARMGGVHVASGDLDGDGRSDAQQQKAGISTSRSNIRTRSGLLANPSSGGDGTYYVIVLKDIMISGVQPNPDGTISGMKAKEKMNRTK